MSELIELSQRLTAVEKRVNQLAAEFSNIRSELSNKIDSNNSDMMDRIIELERERVRLSTILDGIQARMTALNNQPNFEQGFQEKVAQFSLFCAAAAIGAFIVRFIERIVQ